MIYFGLNLDLSCLDKMSRSEHNFRLNANLHIGFLVFQVDDTSHKHAVVQCAKYEKKESTCFTSEQK